MAQYPVRHTCGHDITHNLFGKTTERDSKLAWLRTQPCLECKRAAESAAAEQSPVNADLVALSGSEKQVGWAKTIRVNLLEQIATEREKYEALGRRQGAAEELIVEGLRRFDAAVSRVKAQASAAWWIDRRSSGAMSLIQEAAREAAHEAANA